MPSVPAQLPNQQFRHASSVNKLQLPHRQVTYSWMCQVPFTAGFALESDNNKLMQHVSSTEHFFTHPYYLTLFTEDINL